MNASARSLCCGDCRHVVGDDIIVVSKEHILAEIQRTAAGGSALGKRRFEAETGIRESDWHGRFWTRWSEAVREAGCEPNLMQKAFPEEQLLQSLVSLIRELGRFPTSGDLKIKSRDDPDFPSHNTFSRLGRKAECARRVVEFCSSQDGCDDVANLARPLAASSTSPDTDRDKPEVADFGFVDLMKSGRYYKIGRSDSVERRAYEIRLQLPEELKLIHKIKTDDPVGIEAYWHQRFSDRRVRGEWFSLTREDVKAFARRKFM